MSARLDRTQNNLAYWFPKLQATGVSVPRTSIVEADDEIVMAAYGKPAPALDPLVERLTAAARVFGFPVFLRSGYGSGKHEWKDTCFVKSPEDIRSHVLAICEWSEIVDMLGLPTRTWVVREMLPMEATFRAFHGGMPVNKERRYFFESGKVRCHHSYWPPAALEGQVADCADWEEKLAAMNHESSAEIEYLTAQTERVACEFLYGGRFPSGEAGTVFDLSKFDNTAWSIDWAQTAAGEWYAIDMALAAHSYHWEGCPEKARWERSQREMALDMLGMREAK